MVGVEAQDPLGYLTLIRSDLKMVGYVDAADHEHVAVEPDLARHLRSQPALAGRNPARLQRAPEGTGESAGGGGDEVVKRRRVRFVNVRVYAVVFRYLGVHSE